MFQTHTERLYTYGLLCCMKGALTMAPSIGLIVFPKRRPPKLRPHALSIVLAKSRLQRAPLGQDPAQTWQTSCGMNLPKNMWRVRRMRDHETFVVAVEKLWAQRHTLKTWGHPQDTDLIGKNQSHVNSPPIRPNSPQ